MEVVEDTVVEEAYKVVEEAVTVHLLVAGEDTMVEVDVEKGDPV